MIETKPNPYDEGFAAQDRGTYIDECPYASGSQEYRAWHDGYDDGEIADYLRMAASGEIE